MSSKYHICDVCKERIRDITKARSSFGKYYHWSCSRQIDRKSKELREEIICLPYPTVLSDKTCIFIGCDSNETDLTTIKRGLRIRCSAVKGIILKLHSKCCSDHMNRLKSLDFTLNDIQTIGDSTNVSLKEAKEIIIGFQLVAKAEHERAAKPRRFADKTDNELINEIGMTRQKFAEMKNIAGITGFKSSLTLYVYLLKMVSGMSERRIGSYVGLARQTVSYHARKARRALEPFVNRFLGFRRFSVSDVLSHSTEIARKLFSTEKSIFVADGTYAYIQKSTNNPFQRLTFSGHKHQHLFKMFMIVLTDGLTFDVTGPHEANRSDGLILLDLLKNPEFKRRFPSDQVLFIVDRGFRDTINEVRQMGYQVGMPGCLGGKKQMTTNEANISRLVTKIRYIVEVVNGQIKQFFLYFRNRIYNAALGTASIDFKICVAILNYLKNGNFISDKDDVFITDRMLSLVNKKNSLADLVAGERLTYRVNDRSTTFVAVDSSSDIAFPRLTEKQLKEYLCGSYHLKIAKSYFSEHVKSNGIFRFYVKKENKHINYSSY